MACRIKFGQIEENCEKSRKLQLEGAFMWCLTNPATDFAQSDDSSGVGSFLLPKSAFCGIGIEEYPKLCRKAVRVSPARQQ